MMMFRFSIFTILTFLYLSHLPANEFPLISTESDPDAFIQNSVNVLNGDYCESSTDLVIAGPDALVLQRFYSTKNPVTGNQVGGWRMLPERFLVMGKDPAGKSCTVGEEQLEWVSAFTGERSGGILPYCGWKSMNGTMNDPLKIDGLNDALGMVNTYAEEINGQTNHQNNLLHCKDDACLLTLGDGTQRIYQKTAQLPSLILGEELTPWMAAQVIEPQCFHLTQEILPSGNQIFFSYDAEGHLLSVEMKNRSETKVLSWIRFTYDFQAAGCQVHIETSDGKTLTYHLVLEQRRYQLKRVEGSHAIPVSYEYAASLVKKTLPEGRFIEIEYEQEKVKSLKGPDAISGKSIIVYSFSYGKDYTS